MILNGISVATIGMELAVVSVVCVAFMIFMAVAGVRAIMQRSREENENNL